MKTKIISCVIFLTLTLSVFAQQSTRLDLSYDNSGNRIRRQLIIISMPATSPPFKQPNPVDSVNTVDLPPKDSIVQESKNNLPFKNILVYPNPAQTTIKIEIKDQISSEYTAIIYDIKGKEMIRKAFNQSTYEIDLSYLVTADYFLEVVSNGKKVVWKIIKN